MAEKVAADKNILPPAKSLFLTFEGTPPDGAFITAFSSKEAAVRYCEARNARFPTYWQEYRAVEPNLVESLLRVS